MNHYINLRIFLDHAPSMEDLQNLHKVLAGNKDYIDSNIIYNLEDPPTIYIYPHEFKASSDSVNRLHKLLDAIFQFSQELHRS